MGLGGGGSWIRVPLPPVTSVCDKSRHLSELQLVKMGLSITSVRGQWCGLSDILGQWLPQLSPNMGLVL